MQIRFELSPDDLATIAKESQSGTPIYTLQVALFTILGILFLATDVILLLVFVFTNEPSIRVPDLAPSLLIKAVIWFVFMVAVAVISRLYLNHSMNKANGQPGHNGIFCEHLIELEEAGFTESTEVNRTFHAWKGVESVRETDNYVHLKIRLGDTYFIPKRAFQSDSDRHSFVAAATQNIDRASVPNPPAFK